MRNDIVWDEEFRVTLFQVDEHKPTLLIKVYSNEEQDEKDLVGEAELAIETWKDNEFDGELPPSLIPASHPRCSCASRQCVFSPVGTAQSHCPRSTVELTDLRYYGIFVRPEWIPLATAKGLRGEIFFEMTFYPVSYYVLSLPRLSNDEAI